MENKDTIEMMLYTHRISQLSKALWKTIEKDWQNWIKPYGLNINEHHILIIIRNLEYATISQVSQYGVMHVSTVFNFAKKLESQGLLRMPKSEYDKRNTYLELTDKGKELLKETYEGYMDMDNRIADASQDYKNLIMTLPHFTDLTYLVSKIYGKDFINQLDKSHDDMMNILLDASTEDDA